MVSLAFSYLNIFLDTPSLAPADSIVVSSPGHIASRSPPSHLVSALRLLLKRKSSRYGFRHSAIQVLS